MTAQTSPRDQSAYARKSPKVPPFARYKGTSAWRKFKRRVREYALFQARSARTA